MNHIDWDNGNIVEFDDFMGSSTPRRISKYSYFADKADGNAVVLPSILERYSEPLMRAGVFGAQPANLLASESVRDKDGELLSNRRFDYDFADGLVKSYYSLPGPIHLRQSGVRELAFLFLLPGSEGFPFFRRLFGENPF